MLDKIIENLFRLLMDDLNKDQKVESEFIKNKINLMKVLLKKLQLLMRYIKTEQNLVLNY